MKDCLTPLLHIKKEKLKFMIQHSADRLDVLKVSSKMRHSDEFGLTSDKFKLVNGTSVR